MSDQRCPEKTELSAFVRCELSDHRAEEIVEHLTQCGHCEETVANFETRLDRLIRPLSADLSQRDVAGADARADPVDDGNDGQEDNCDTRRKLRDYELLDKIGEGGMGIVYKARHTRLQRVVALKVLPTRHFDNPEAVARFQREMYIVGGLDHPHIARASDAGEEDGTHYLVMDLVHGKNLSQLVKEQGQLRIPDACAIIYQAANGLQYAHEHGLVHRDIKPSNLILSAASESGGTDKPTLNGTVKILDFGLALLSDAQQPSQGELTQVGQLMGTLDYMAPEQTENARQVDIRADIYALGATIYRLLAGSAPFASGKHDTPLEKLNAIAKEEPTPIIEVRPDVPRQLATIVHRMLAKRPDDRYATPAEVAQALLPFTNGANLALLLRSSAGRASVTAATPGRQTSENRRDRNPAADGRLGAPKRSSPRRSVVWTAAAFLLAIGLAGVLYRVSTNYGTLLIEIDDPALQALLKQDGVIIRDTQAKRHWTITTPKKRLPTGDYEVVSENVRFLVTDDAGLEVETDEFALRRGDHTRIRIKFMPPPAAQVVNEFPHMPAEWKPGPPTRWPGLAAHPTRFDAFRRWQVYLATPRQNALVRWSPDETMVAIADHDGLIRIYRVNDRQFEPFCFFPAGGHGVGDMSWSPDSKRIVSIDSETVRWGNVVTRTPGPAVKLIHAPYAVAWCPVRNIIAVGTSQGQISFFTSEGKDITAFPAHSQGVLWLDWSQQGTLASIGEDGSLILWDQNGAKMWSTEVGTRARQAVWSNQGTHVAVRYEGWEHPLALRVYDVGRRRLVSHLEHWAPFRDIAWLSDDEIAGCHDNGHLAIWRIGEPEISTSYPVTGPGNLVHLSVATNSRLIVLDSETRGPLLFDLELKRILAPLPQIPMPLTSVAINPTGDRIATGRQNGDVLVWDVSGKLLQQIDTNTEQSSALDVSWQTDDIIACATEAGIRLYDVTSGTLEKTLRAMGIPVAWDHNGTHLMARAADGRLVVWDSQSDETQTLMDVDAWLHTAWSPTRPVLAISLTSGTIVTHDFEDGTQKELSVAGAEGLAWTPDGTTLITAEKPDGDISAWDLASGHKRWSSPGAYGPIATHPNGEFLVSFRQGQLVNIADGSRIGTFPTSRHEETGGWTSDGRYFAFHDGVSLEVWDGRTLHPLWRAIPFANERTLVLTAAGECVAGDSALVEQHLLYVVEDRDGNLSVLHHAEFMRQAGQKQNRGGE